MAQKSKKDVRRKVRQKENSEKEKSHPDQATAELEEKKTQQWEEESPRTGNVPDISDNEGLKRAPAKGKDVFPIIGIGASAGGLDALEKFLSNVPEEAGMAFVVISHTDPEKASMLPDILKRKSKLEVSLVEDGTSPEPNRVYLPPSDKDLVIRDRVFNLEERQRRDGLHMPIDRFMRSLAEDRGDRAGCVILSGTGTDGTQGLRAIKEKAGVAIAQSKETARHFGMPQSAIDTGLVDFVLAPEEMPEELTRCFQHPGMIEPKEAEEHPPKSLQNILSCLANRTRHDFSHYKKSTMIRRIERRMSVTKSRDSLEYLRYLHRDPKEAEALFEDLLIGVTSFFRDPEEFSFLREEVLPDIIGESSKDDPFRIWIPGCSTGEEAYSVAIIVQEVLEETNTNRRMQTFATDLDKKAIERARYGAYLENIAADVSPERLERFFTKEDHLYRVRRELREPIVFAVQNVLRDPPFSNLDLLVCRNLLIYLEASAQQKLIPLFHYTLKPGGILFLGSSESVGRFGELFEPVAKKYSVYRKKEVGEAARPMVEFPTGAPRLESAADIREQGPEDLGEGIAQATERILLKKHTPTCVVVDREGRILYIHGRTGKYLEHPEGRPSLNILDSAREGIRYALSSGLRKAGSSGEEVRQDRLRVKTNGDYQELNLVVKPVSEPPVLKNTSLIIFEELGSKTEKEIEEKAKGQTDDHNGRIIELERELSRVRHEYQGSLEELQSSNEELRSANEEINSSNEELQSTNEELESSREELQSLNEELSTVNNELHVKTEELSRAYERITNVLDSIQIAILFLTNDLSIKRFTSEATRIFNLIDSDVGRPLDHISHRMEFNDFTQKVRWVLDTLRPFEDDVRTQDGHWYRMRIMIFRDDEKVIEGVVLTFINIDPQKQAQEEIERMSAEEIQAQRRFAESIVDTVRESLLVLDGDYRVVTANRRFYETFELSPEKVEGRTLFEVGEGQWEIEELRELLNEILLEGKSFEDYRVEHRFKTLGLKHMLLNARLLREDGNKKAKILLAIEEVTGKHKD